MKKQNKNKIIQSALLFLLVLFFAFPVFAADEISFTPQIAIPGSDKITSNDLKNGTAIGKYITIIYNYSIGAVGILATITMMWGGVRWLTAGGNKEAVADAQSWIKGSLTGLVLMMCSYIILHTVNPDLTYFRPIVITPIKQEVPKPELDNSYACGSTIKGNVNGNVITLNAMGNFCTKGTCQATTQDANSNFGDTGVRTFNGQNWTCVNTP